MGKPRVSLEAVDGQHHQGQDHQGQDHQGQHHQGQHHQGHHRVVGVQISLPVLIGITGVILLRDPVINPVAMASLTNLNLSHTNPKLAHTNLRNRRLSQDRDTSRPDRADIQMQHHWPGLWPPRTKVDMPKQFL